jgi:hypothetical protein
MGVTQNCVVNTWEVAMKHSNIAARSLDGDVQPRGPRTDNSDCSSSALEEVAFTRPDLGIAPHNDVMIVGRQ